MYNLATPGTTYYGVRVTAKNTTTSALGSMAITTGAVSSAFVGNAGTTTDSWSSLRTVSNAVVLTAGGNAPAAGVNSNVLDLVAAYALFENPVPVSSTGGTTIRVSWLGV